MKLREIIIAGAVLIAAWNLMPDYIERAREWKQQRAFDALYKCDAVTPRESWDRCTEVYMHEKYDVIGRLLGIKP